jgi:hypothetical protein
MRTIFAFCDATCVIKFGEVVPSGCVAIVKGEESAVRELIADEARAWKGPVRGMVRTYMIPGAMAATGQKQRMDCVIAFQKQLTELNDERFDFMKES